MTQQIKYVIIAIPIIVFVLSVFIMIIIGIIIRYNLQIVDKELYKQLFPYKFQNSQFGLRKSIQIISKSKDEDILFFVKAFKRILHIIVIDFLLMVIIVLVIGLLSKLKLL